MDINFVLTFYKFRNKKKHSTFSIPLKKNIINYDLLFILNLKIMLSHVILNFYKIEEILKKKLKKS